MELSDIYLAAAESVGKKHDDFSCVAISRVQDFRLGETPDNLYYYNRARDRYATLFARTAGGQLSTVDILIGAERNEIFTSTPQEQRDFRVLLLLMAWQETLAHGE